MKTRFICFANSYKEGGRCLAGIEVDANNIPVFVNLKPKWIRPVCNTTHGEIPTDLSSHINILDIVEIDVTGSQRTNYQTENVFFDQNSINVTGKFDLEDPSILCDNRRVIFGNAGRTVSQDAIKNLDHSLLLLRTDEFEVVEKTYPDSKKIQARLIFDYHGNEYDFPLTDPAFMKLYKNDPEFYESYSDALLCVSLGIAWKDWYYKLVAGIILLDD